MKKRKELNALLGKRQGGSYQELNQPRNPDVLSSSSRDGDHYITPEIMNQNRVKRINRSFVKRQYCCTGKGLFYICVPICILTLIVACVTSSIGIVWMQMQLKHDMDEIKDRLFKLERWKIDEPASLANMQDTISSLEQEIMKIKDGDDGIRVLNTNLATLKQEFENKHQKVATTLMISQVLQDIDNMKQKMEENLELPQRYKASLEEHDTMFNSSLETMLDRVKALEVISNPLTSQFQPLLAKHSAFEEELNILLQRFQTLNDSMIEFCKKDRDLKNSDQDEVIAHISSSTVTSLPAANANNELHSVDNGKEQTQFNPDKKVPISPTVHLGDKNKVLSDLTEPFADKSSSFKIKSGSLDQNGVEKTSLILNQAGDKSVYLTHDSDVQVGDTTTSFTELPTEKHSHDGTHR